MDALWPLWLITAGIGALLGAFRRPSPSGWLFDALLLFLLASLVCDGLALFGVIDGWRLNPYAIGAGFVFGAALRQLMNKRSQAAPS